MEKKKTPYTGVHSLLVIPIDQVAVFVLVQSKAVIHASPGNYQVEFTPGTFSTDIQEETSEDGPIYNINHTFNVSFNSMKNNQTLKMHKSQKVIAIYTNEAGQRVVSGSKDYPLVFTYTPTDSLFLCKLTGSSTKAQAYL